RYLCRDRTNAGVKPRRSVHRRDDRDRPDVPVVRLSHLASRQSGTSQFRLSEASNIMQQPVTDDSASAAVRVLDVAKKRNLTIVAAESCTAGMLSTILSE